MSGQAAPYQVDEPGDSLPRGAPPGQVSDPSYKTSKGEEVPVVDDDAPLDDPMKPDQADSSKQLERDERDAIDKGNIVKDRTRHAAKPAGAYAEPTDEQMGLRE